MTRLTIPGAGYVKRLLGKGATSRVYATDAGVVKIVTNPELVNNEISILNSLAETKAARFFSTFMVALSKRVNF